MVKAAGFELRIVQLWVRNLTDSANLFRETHSNIKCTLKLTPWLPRWPPYCKNDQLTLWPLLVLITHLHSPLPITWSSFSARAMGLLLQDWTGAHYQTARRAFFDYKTLRGHTRTLPNLMAAFFISEFEGFCTFFFELPDCTGAHYQTARWLFFTNLGVSAHFWLPDFTGLPPRWWLLFLPPKTDHFKYYYTLITLLHSLRHRPLLLHTPQVTWLFSINFSSE